MYICSVRGFCNGEEAKVLEGKGRTFYNTGDRRVSIRSNSIILNALDYYCS